jgi:hypothetical protein
MITVDSGDIGSTAVRCTSTTLSMPVTLAQHDVAGVVRRITSASIASAV